MICVFSITVVSPTQFVFEIPLNLMILSKTYLPLLLQCFHCIYVCVGSNINLFDGKLFLCRRFSSECLFNRLLSFAVPDLVTCPLRHVFEYRQGGNQPAGARYERTRCSSSSLVVIKVITDYLQALVLYNRNNRLLMDARPCTFTETTFKRAFFPPLSLN